MGFIGNIKSNKIPLLAKALKISPLSLLGVNASKIEYKTCNTLKTTHGSLIKK